MSGWAGRSDEGPDVPVSVSVHPRGDLRSHGRHGGHGLSLRLRRRFRSLPATWVFLLLGATALSVARAAPADLIVLQETGRMQDSLPVLQPSPRSPEVIQVLTRGFSDSLLHLHNLEQVYLQRQQGREPQPAVLLLSHRQGGFPCRGFVLDGRVERDRDFVDLDGKSGLCGSFGAMDQIFPHELAHVMVRELAGDAKSGGSNQIHAVGVATDEETAFSEGFAEHMQIMALNDPGADARTRAIVAGRRAADWAAGALGQYRRELTARAAWFTPRRTGFVLWFSRAEQIQRYYDVLALFNIPSPSSRPSSSQDRAVPFSSARQSMSAASAQKSVSNVFML